jgi:hypothetical protein
MDPWPHSEAGRFHRGISLMLVGLAVLILLVEGIRHHGPPELVVLAGVLSLAGAAGARLLRDFLAHPANFPAPAPSHGLAVRGALADAPHAKR